MYKIIADNNEINSENLSKWLMAFKTDIMPERIKMGEYYDGENPIVKQNAVEGRPNYSVNVNMAKYITDVATSYTFGKPATYSLKEGDNKLLNLIERTNRLNYTDELDYQLGGDMSVYGIAYQLIYQDRLNPQTPVKFKRLEPTRTFMVCDNTIEENIFCAVYFYDYIENSKQKSKLYIWDKTYLYTFDGFGTYYTMINQAPHNFDDIPVIQSLNNDDAFGDFKMVVGLLDSLNLMISNNTDDLQSVSNAILAVSGGKLGEEEINQINSYKVANLPLGANMQWIIKNSDTTGVFGQIKYLLNFIFQISMVPDLSDEAFAGNLSGVAMQFKMWGIDQLWMSKIRKYKTCLNKRIKMILKAYGLEDKLADDIQINFYKNLPENMAQDYEIAKNLSNVLSLKTILRNLSIVQDVEAEYNAIQEERQENKPSPSEFS